MKIFIALAALAAAACGRSDARSDDPPAEEAEAAGDESPETVMRTFAEVEEIEQGKGFIRQGARVVLPDPREGGRGTGGEGGAGGARQRFGETPVYLDGVALAVLSYPELPPWLPTRPIDRGEGYMVSRFRLTEYIEALGIDLRRVKAVHLYGGRSRVALLPGHELRRDAQRILFSFTAGESGKARMHWTQGVKVSDSIDKLTAMTIYVDKEPPTWDRGLWSLVDADGKPFDGIPYAETELRGGVRVYYDGRLAFVLKRKEIFEKEMTPHEEIDGAPAFRLFDFLTEQGAEIGPVAAVELIHHSEIAARLEGDAVSNKEAPLRFSAPARAKGQVSIHYAVAGEPAAQEITAISLLSPRRSAARHRR